MQSSDAAYASRRRYRFGRKKGGEGLFHRSENLNMIPDRIAFIENIEKSRIYQIDCTVFFHIIYNVYGFYYIRNIF